MKNVVRDKIIISKDTCRSIADFITTDEPLLTFTDIAKLNLGQSFTFELFPAKRLDNGFKYWIMKSKDGFESILDYADGVKIIKMNTETLVDRIFSDLNQDKNGEN